MGKRKSGAGVIQRFPFKFIYKVASNITNFPCNKTNFPFYKTITNFLYYKTNFPIYKAKLCIKLYDSGGMWGPCLPPPLPPFPPHIFVKQNKKMETKDSKLFKNIMFLYRFSCLCCAYCAVFQTLGFFLLSYWKSSIPYWYCHSLNFTAKAHLGPT